MAVLGRGWTKTLAVAALLLGAGRVGFAQSAPVALVQNASDGAQSGSLAGKLTDLYSKPLEGIALVARNQATGAEARTVTAKNGAYRFSSLAPGEYALEAESPQLGRGRVESIMVSAGYEARVQAAMEFEPLPPAPVLARSEGANQPALKPTDLSHSGLNKPDLSSSDLSQPDLDRPGPNNPERGRPNPGKLNLSRPDLQPEGLLVSGMGLAIEPLKILALSGRRLAWAAEIPGPTALELSSRLAAEPLETLALSGRELLPTPPIPAPPVSGPNATQKAELLQTSALAGRRGQGSAPRTAAAAPSIASTLTASISAVAPSTPAGAASTAGAATPVPARPGANGAGKPATSQVASGRIPEPRLALPELAASQPAQGASVSASNQPGETTAQAAMLTEPPAAPPPPKPILAASQQGDPVSPAVTSTMSAHELQSLPVSGRNWQDFVLDNAPSSVTPAGGQGQISLRGAGQQPVEVSVDGMSKAMAFGPTGGSSGSGRGSSGQGPLGQGEGGPAGIAQVGFGGHGLALSEAAIHEVQTAAGNVEAAENRAAGGRMNVETQRGTNELHGQAFLFDRQNAWGAQNPFSRWTRETAPATATTPPVFTPFPYTPLNRETTWGVGVGGRIRRNKLFWFAALDGYNRDDPGVSTVRNPAVFFALPTKNADAQMEVLSARMGPSSNPLAAGVAQYSSMLETLDGLLGPAPRAASQWTGFGRLDWQVGERNRFILEGIGARWNSPGGGLTRVSETYGNHSYGSTKASEEWLLGRWESFLTPNLLAVTQASMGHAIQESRPSAPSAFEQKLLAGNLWGQLPQIVVDNRYGFTIGNPSRFGQGSYPDEHLYQGRESVDWVRGKLLVKAGFEVSRNSDATSLLRNQTGTYTYANVVNFTSDVWALENGFGELNPNGPQHNCDETGEVWHDSGGNLRGVGNLPCYSYYSQTLGPSGWSLSTSDWAGYATAQWQASKLLVVSAGLRWEREQLPPPLAALSNPELPLTEKLPSLGNNWGPRVALAYGSRGRHWPVVRLGYGIYYGRTANAAIETALTQTGTVALDSTGELKGDLSFFMRPTDDLPNNAGGAPPFPYVPRPPGPGSAIKPGAVEFAPNFRNSEVHQAVASVEETMPAHIKLTASAMVSLGRRLPISIDTNFDPAVNPGTITYAVCDESSTTSACGFAGVGPIKTSRITVPFYASWPSPTGLAGRLNPDYQQITQIMSRANSTYEAATLKLDRYGRRGLSLHAHYTYSHAMDWNPNESAQVAGNDVLDPAAFSPEYGTSNLDVRHAAAVTAIYGVPWKLRGTAGKLGNGWIFSGVAQFRSGLPYTMRTSGALPKEFTASGTAIVGLGPGINGSGGDNRVYGIGRNTYRYPATWKADLRLARRFDLGHMRQLELLVESFNLFNHQNVTELETTGYYIESGSATSPPTLNYLTGLKANTTAFGQPLNINATNFYRPRQIQLGLRMRF